MLLSIQRALLGCITPELRAVTASFKNKLLHIIFYYDGEISSNNREIAEEIIGEILFDFEGSSNKIEIIRLDYPEKIICLDVFAYFRHEE